MSIKEKSVSIGKYPNQVFTKFVLDCEQKPVLTIIEQQEEGAQPYIVGSYVVALELAANQALRKLEEQDLIVDRITNVFAKTNNQLKDQLEKTMEKLLSVQAELDLLRSRQAQLTEISPYEEDTHG